MSGWPLPDGWHRIETIDAHTAGEPFRVVVDGFPEIKGDSVLARRRYARQHLDHLRRALMWEPRGHADMYGCLLIPPDSEAADLAVLFMHNAGYSTMCGHGIIGLVTVAIEAGLVQTSGQQPELAIETPAGLVHTTAFLEGGHVRSVRFRNVPSFVVALDQVVEVPEYGQLRYDLAFGGAYYAFLDAASIGLPLSPEASDGWIKAGRAVKQAVSQQRTIEHPYEADLGFLYGAIFIGPADKPQSHSRNVCIFADGEVDRCPTGTGVSARLAIHWARGEIDAGQWIEVESIIGTRFRGRVTDETDFGLYPAIVPEIEGTAHLTGRHTFVIDPTDPLRNGFLLR